VPDDQPAPSYEVLAALVVSLRAELVAKRAALGGSRRVGAGRGADRRAGGAGQQELAELLEATELGRAGQTGTEVVSRKK
jgi:hypothetical protein